MLILTGENGENVREQHWASRGKKKEVSLWEGKEKKKRKKKRLEKKRKWGKVKWE